MGGVQYKYAEFKLQRLEKRVSESNLNPFKQGKMYETELIQEYGKRYPYSTYDSQCHLNSNDLVNSKGAPSYQMPDLVVEGKSGSFTNYDFKWGDAGKTFNQKVLTGIGGTTSGTGTGTSNVLDTIISNTKTFFSTNIVPSGTPFIEIHQGMFNNVVGVPLSPDLFIGINSWLQSLLSAVGSHQ